MLNIFVSRTLFGGVFLGKTRPIAKDLQEIVGELSQVRTNFAGGLSSRTFYQVVFLLKEWCCYYDKIGKK